jgi:hypothetical protein
VNLPQITQIFTEGFINLRNQSDSTKMISAKISGKIIYHKRNKRKQKIFANTCGRFNSHKEHEGSQIIFFENLRDLREKLVTTHRETKENKRFLAKICGNLFTTDYTPARLIHSGGDFHRLILR